MARNAELNEKIRDERRAEIISAALKLFASKGLQATKVADIAAALNISQGLMYHYFRSKEEIFVELVKNAFENLNSAARWLEEQDMTPVEKIRMATEKLLETVDQSEEFAVTCLLLAHANASEAIPKEAQDIIRREYRVPYEVMTRIFREGQKDGSVKNHDAETMALAFWTSINGLAIYKAVHSETFKLPDPSILLSMFI